MACQTLMPVPATPETPAATQPAATTESIVTKLEELGGEACAEKPDLICVSIPVPLNHFDSANTETINVTFAVSPALGTRYGMFIQAFPGGPGGEGIGSSYLGYISDDIQQHYDIVFFDQRGIGLSNPLECPVAYEKDFIGYLTEFNTAGQEGYDTVEEQQALVNDTRAYVEECVSEIGIDPAKLAFFGTNQVAEDIETFRETIGDEKIWMYGVSYGTAVAQTYARAYPNRLAGLILDGTINMTLSGEDSLYSQERAFDKVLVATLQACNEDDDCSADMGGEDAVAVYDKLAAQVSKKPLAYEFPLPNGEKAKGTFTFNQLEYTTAYQMYSLEGRMIFLRALASANSGDLVPMLRLMYLNTLIDPATFDYLGDPTFSDTMFLGVFCTDDDFFSGTQEERIAQSIEAGQASNGTVPRLDGSAYTGVTCAFWPSSPKEEVVFEPLVLEGVPTFVLNATLDPATPFEEGQFVAQNLADGYHIYVEGGVHSIYGWGYECPDNYITDFMVDGTLPSEHEIVCKDWDPTPFSLYFPNLPKNVNGFADALDLARSLDENFYYLPEFYYGDWEEQTTVGCTYGGTFTFGPGQIADQYAYDQCAMMPDLILNGTGQYTYDTRVFSFTVDISGAKTGSLNYRYDYKINKATVTGVYDGKTIELEQQD